MPCLLLKTASQNWVFEGQTDSNYILLLAHDNSLLALLAFAVIEKASRALLSGTTSHLLAHGASLLALPALVVMR